MNHSELIKAVADHVDLPSTKVAKVIEAVAGLINLKTLIQGEDVRIHDFGTFKQKVRPARNGRNPQNGEVIKIAESTVITFKPTKHK